MAQIYLYRDVIGYWDANCKKYDYYTSESTTSSYALGYSFLVWVVVFLCIFQGVKSSSYVVWFTVPGPVLFIIIMIIKNCGTLEGASTGVDWYLNGRPGEKYDYSNVIPDAVG